MKNKFCKNFILIFIMLIMIVSPTLAGCFSVGSIQLKTPEITLHKESKCLSWGMIANTKKYEIYCNDVLVDSVANDITQSSIIYEFQPLLEEVGEYKFYIIAIANSTFNQDSEKSNEVSFSYAGEVDIVAPGDTTVKNDDNYKVGIAINNTRVDLALLTNLDVDGYELYLYSQSTGLNVYPIDVEACRNSTNWNSCSIELLNSIYNLQDEIYAIRIGYVKNGEHVICSDIRYINPEGYAKYCDEIYLFDGQINDMYLENIQELRNLIYYSFIYKDSTLEVKLSKQFHNLIEVYEGVDGKTDFRSKFLAAIVEAFNYFFETRDGYDISIGIKSESESIYTININYDYSLYLNSLGKTEPELAYTPPYYYYEEIEWDGYYETCGYTMRADDEKYAETEYKFASDQQFLYTTVSSSEQLYWAVENKVTPICVPGSRAETIYNLAKDTLNSIISDNMTDYEKALCIYDWICENTSYDYYALLQGSYNGLATLVPVYYLEGVFMTGYAVCDGFSKAFSLMCNMEGIDAIRIVGTASGGGHAWNKVAIDINPTDEIGAQYYVVDITWTEMKGSMFFNEQYYNRNPINGYEVSSHEFFLVDDDYIKSTHVAFDKREKYKLYATGERYNYYNETTINFDGDDYGVVMSDNNTEFDLVIDHEDDLTAIFYYMFVNNLEAIEVVIDYDFMVEVDKEAGGSGVFSDKMLTNLTNLMRSKKFLSQYLFLNHNYYPTTVYNSDGDMGLIMVLENNLLIDDINEVGHLLEFMTHYNVYGTYEIYIDYNVLNQAIGATALSKTKNLFASALNSDDVVITFAQTQKSTTTQACYMMTVSPKTV